ncbi:MAG: hypothetical protein ACYC26_07435 [Phycisphaerales bacterium]
MPLPGKRWRLITISTYAAWLPGDARGFRSRDHKIHSNGDYKHRPPVGEHAGLLDYAETISGPTVIIPVTVRRIVGWAIIEKLRKLDHRVLAVSVSGKHAHFVVELPDNLKQMRSIVGQCKAKASHVVRETLPGRVWARDGDYQPLDDRSHQINAYRYTLRQDGAWVWSYKGWEQMNPRNSKTRPRGLT